MIISKGVISVILSITYFLSSAFSQPLTSKPFKTLNVADGLPQSFISGIVQDSAGFIWIGTRDGLARYDGRKFKLFRHLPGDTTTIANSVISGLYLDKHKRLWIRFETGDMDVIHTGTEALFHFTKDTVFRPAFLSLRGHKYIAEDSAGNIWLLSTDGDLLFCDLKKKKMDFYSHASLGLQGNKILSITSFGNDVLLITDTALLTINKDKKLSQIEHFSFQKINEYNSWVQRGRQRIMIRRTGEIIIKDDNKLLISDPVKKSFFTLTLPGKPIDNKFWMTQDNRNNIFLSYNDDIYVLSTDNKLTLWEHKNESLAIKAVSILYDNSGVLWIGSNGNGIRLFDLRITHLSGLPYQKNFHEDILQNVLQVPAAEIKNTFLYNMYPYSLQWAAGKNGRIWLSKSGAYQPEKTELCYFENGHIVSPPWHYADTLSAERLRINSMAFSKSGKLWGVDFKLRPIYFDTLNYAITMYPYPSIAAPSPESNPSYAVNSLLIQGEDTFWISTTFNGLYCYNRLTGKIINYTYREAAGALPTNLLMSMIKAPADNNILWIGSLGGGLIKFDKTTGKCRVYTTNDGLPNNTVYAITTDAKGILWCSSNKGIFSFQPETGFVRSFTSKDGLQDDEFNRYHFLQLPDGRIAFGGVNGYTVFDPLSIADDTFQPPVALTGIHVNNIPADFGYAGSPFKKAINSLDKIVLPYNQNFLTFEFAGLEYNISEKLQYRYKLEKFDKTWVNAGNENFAAYTNIPPGNYLLKINATNTANKWSTHVKTLSVIILPPFWKTWWFTLLWILATATFTYLLIRYRISGVRKEEQQKAAFEREALELRAEALQLKAEALRAQMNPHFIFNCLNSIKSLIQKEKKQEAVIYLTTFSKLIRNQLNNAQREISLQEELETCRLYAQLEALRFGTKIICEFKVEEGIDTYSLHVPPLILQPFIENAIWHGILPKDGGNIKVSVTRNDKYIECAIEDDGIGRELSLHNKSQTYATYQSKGMKLVQGRLNVHNSINNHGGTIELIDKKDTYGKGSGTLVIVKFKEV